MNVYDPCSFQIPVQAWIFRAFLATAYGVEELRTESTIHIHLDRQF